METIEERAMEKYWPDDFKQETVEKISTEVASYITEQIESAINEEKQRSMGTIEERAKEYAPDPFLAALERKAYIAGVTAQKDIDMENACKACESELRRIKSLLNEVGVSSNLISVGQSLSNIMREMHENN